MGFYLVARNQIIRLFRNVAEFLFGTLQTLLFGQSKETFFSFNLFINLARGIFERESFKEFSRVTEKKEGQ